MRPRYMEECARTKKNKLKHAHRPTDNAVQWPTVSERQPAEHKTLFFIMMTASSRS